MREILTGRLWLGHALEARDLRALYGQQLAAVVDLADNELPAQLGRDMIYCRIPLMDGGGNPPALIELAVTSVVALVEGNVRVLVACSAGMSRSPAIAAAALAKVTRTPLDECLLTIVTGFPHDVSPPLWADVKHACQQARGA